MKKIESLSELTYTGSFQLIDDVYISESYIPLEEFNGVLDGNGYTIYNLQTGLIQDLHKEATIKNLTIDSPSLKITGDSTVKGVFDCNEGLIKNCTIDEISIEVRSLDSTSVDMVGGLVSENRNEIQNCTVTGSITGSIRFGGLIAGISFGTPNNHSKVIGCSTDGDISGYSNIGGLVGSVRNSKIIDCTTDGHVQAQSYIGGICGGNEDSTYQNCTVKSLLTGVSVIGGLIGSSEVTEQQAIESCTFSGKIKAGESIGGLVGCGIITICDSTFDGLLQSYEDKMVGGLIGDVWDSTLSVENCTISGQINSNKIGGILGSTNETTEDTDIQVKNTTIKPKISSEQFFDTDHWEKKSNTVKLKVIQSNSKKVQVQSEEDLYACSPSDTIELVDDIYVSDSESVIFKEFKGEFNGNGHTIYNINTLFDCVRKDAKVSNVTIAEVQVEIAELLFGVITRVNHGIIKNIQLTDVHVSGSSITISGGVVGINKNTVANSTVTNLSISNPYPNTQSGGIVAHNEGEIRYSTISDSTIIGTYITGGIASTSEGTVLDCATEQLFVQGTRLVGGLIGNSQTEDSCVKNCTVSKGIVDGIGTVGGAIGQASGSIYFTKTDAKVTGKSEIGGFCGNIDNANIESCFCSGVVQGSGFAAKCVRSSIKNSYTLHTITTETTYGKFIKSASNSKFEDCFTFVTIQTDTAEKPFYTTTDTSNCYWKDTTDSVSLTDLKLLCVI